jgi:peptide/bleomycin uptake transporter
VFVSFFPRPPLFLLSAILWTIVTVAFWYIAGNAIGTALGFELGGEPPVGASLFWSPGMLWFYVYYAVATGIFALFWRLFAPHPWEIWSIVGSALILLATYLQVQVSVAINSWYGPFYDLIQAALSKSAPVTLPQFYGELATFAGIAFIAVTIAVLNRFFVSHYIFRWRTAMNDYYMANWSRLRTIEGA